MNENNDFNKDELQNEVNEVQNEIIEVDTALTEIKPAEKKKSKKGIIVAIVFLCIIVAGIIAFINNPKNVVKKATTNTVEALSQRKGAYSELLSGFDKSFLSDASNEADFSLQLKANDEGNKLSGAGITVSSKMDVINKLASYNLGVTYQGMNIASADFVANEQQWYLKMPQLYDAWFTGQNENIIKQIANSALNADGSLEYDPEEDVNLDIFSAKETYSTEFINTYITDTALLLNNVVYEKAKEGNNTYLVTIKGEDVKAYIKNIVEALNKEENKALADQLLKNADTDLNEISDAIEATEIKDSVIEITINNKVITHANTDIEFTNEDEASKFNIDFIYEDNTISITLNNYNNSVIVLNDVITNDNNKVNQLDEFIINDNGDESKLSIETSIDENDALSALITAKEQNKTVFEINATGTAVADKNSLKIDFDNIDVIADDDKLSFTSQYYIGELSESIEIPQENVIDIFNESEEKVNEIMSEIRTKIYSLLYALY